MSKKTEGARSIRGSECSCTRADDGHEKIPPQATPEEIEAARERYARPSNDDIEVDDNAGASRAEHGTWVQAWVWLAHEEEDDG